MQSFEIVHVFDCTPAEYLAAIDGPDFLARLIETLSLKERRLVEREDHPTHEVVRLHVVPGTDLPAAMKKALGGKGMSYVEEEVRPKDRPYHREWKVLLDALPPSRFRCGGTFDLEAVGETQTRRRFYGEVDVKLFGVGGIVEGHVRKGIEDSYVKTSAMMRALLAERAAAR